MIVTQHTIRPFDGLAPFQEIVDRMRLRVGNESIGAEGHLLVSDSGYASQPVRLEIAADDAGFDAFVEGTAAAINQLGLELEDVELAVIASSSYLKLVEVLWRCSAGALGECKGVINLTPSDRPRTLTSPRSGARIEVVLCLSRQVKEVPLRPWRRGTWLAQTQFTLHSEVSGNNFRMRPLSDEDRLRMELPKGTLRHVQILSLATDSESGENLAPVTDESSVSVWIDPRLLARISSNPNGAAAKALQLQLFVDVVGAVLANARASDGFEKATSDDLEGTLLGRLLDALVGGRLGPSTSRRSDLKEHLLDLARSDSDRFLTFTAATVGLLQATMEALEQ